MVTLHRELVAHLGGDGDAVILETPYGFQVNRDDISNRAREYFRRSVSLATVVAPDSGADAPSSGTPGDGGADKVRDLVRRADWVFSGPGSPSYALNRWNTLRLGEILHRTGVTRARRDGDGLRSGVHGGIRGSARLRGVQSRASSRVADRA